MDDGMSQLLYIELFFSLFRRYIRNRLSIMKMRCFD